jgi:dihydroorotate dehydrogenase (fumarate)
MRDVSTDYLGLRLRSPFVVAASPLSCDLDTPLLLEDCGAGALVMGSLFEEQIEGDRHYAVRESLAGTRLPHHPHGEEYIERLYHLKERLRIPVIPSLNCQSLGAWTEYARMFEQAGADAIELNHYFLATHEGESPASVDERTIEVVQAVSELVRIPVAVKVSPYHTNLPWFARELVDAGARGLVLFNRFLQPDIDVERMRVRYTIPLSVAADLQLPLTWIAILRHKIDASLAASGGVQRGIDAVKLLAAGADVVQVASALLRHGPTHMLVLCQELETWMDSHSFESVAALRGTMSYGVLGQPDHHERANYVKTLRAWSYARRGAASEPDEGGI